MPPEFPMEREGQVKAFGRKHRTSLVTLLFTDMAGSTALKQRLGDRAAAELFRKHHQSIRDTLRRFSQSEEIETAGDSFLLIFATPSDAVKFALLVRAQSGQLLGTSETAALDRIGIHVGEVMVSREGESRQSTNLFGIQIDTCSRVMSLAKAGQVLMTRAVFDSARQVLKGEEIPGVGQLEWLNHGAYLLKGLDEQVEICEVREQGRDTGGPPAASEKAQRQITPGQEPVLGWRPGVGQLIPGTRWSIEKKLGEGGFGEVWLARNTTTKQAHVFKFCFHAERVRFLKRELTLFRVLKERVGDHPNIVSIYDVFLEQPPFYVEMEYVPGGDLRSWCETRGGVAAIPLERRLEIVAKAADGLQAAHQAGTIHRDIKPGNILISDLGTCLEVKLTDFGIGQVVSEEYLQGITRAGFTQTIVADSSSSRSGTQLYMAPELLAGKPASTRSDIYSLGVVLHQLIAGDLSQPVTTDWAKKVNDVLLREDLARCLAGDLEDRFGSAAELARHLRTLPERRSALARQLADQAEAERAAYRRGIMRAAAVAVVILVAMTALVWLALHQSRKAKVAAGKAAQAALIADRERRSAQGLLYSAHLNLIQTAWDRADVGRVRELLAETESYPERGFEWFYWQRQAHLELLTLRGHSAWIGGLAFSPDSQRIVTSSGDQTSTVWDATTGKLLFRLIGHTQPCLSPMFSPDGQRIATCGADQTVRIWDAATGTNLFAIRAHRNGIWSVSFSPDSQRVVTGSADETAKIWDLPSKRELSTFRGHTSWVSSAVFSPDGRWIVTGSHDHTAKLWDVRSTKLISTLSGHSDGVDSVAFSPDGQHIATASGDHTAKLWTAAGQFIRTFSGHTDNLWSVAFSPDSQRLITGSWDRTAKVWDVQTGKELFTLKGHSSDVRAVFSPDGRRILTGGWDETAKLWDAVGSTETLILKGHSNLVSSVAFSPNSRRVLTGSYDQTARLWDVDTGRVLHTLQAGDMDRILAVAFSHDGQRIVTGGADGVARLWDADTGRALVVHLQGHRAGIGALAFSRDDRLIVTGSQDRTLRVWDAASGKVLQTFTNHHGAIWSAAFSPDGAKVVSGSWDGTAIVWRVSTGKVEFTLAGHEAEVSSVAYFGDGQRIVTASKDGRARIWNASTAAEMLTLAGRSGPILSLAISPDGQRIVTGSADGVARLWNASTATELPLILRGHASGIRAVAFSPDGQRIVTASDDNSAVIWVAASRQQVATWQQEDKAAAAYVLDLRRQREAVANQEEVLRNKNPGVIKEWLVLAPMPFEGADAALALEQAQIPRESSLHPRPGERVKAGRKELVWTALANRWLDFNQLLGEVTDRSVGYAVSYIICQTPQSELLMSVDRADLAKIYLNGQQLGQFGTSRSYPGEEQVEHVGLQAGVNVLILKVVSGRRFWHAAVRFTDPAGQSLQGVRVTLDPSSPPKLD